MSEQPDDGVEETFAGQARVVATAAGHFAEGLLRGQQNLTHEEKIQRERAAEADRARIAAQRRTDLADLGSVHRTGWWEAATPEQIVEKYQTAQAWAAEEPEAVRAAERIREEVTVRHGVGIDDMAGDVAREHARMVAEKGEPRFDVSYYDGDGNSVSHMLSKDQALNAIENMPNKTSFRFSVTKGSGFVTSGSATVDAAAVRGWKGRDPDIDRAISKHAPELMTEEELKAQAFVEQRAGRRDEQDAQSLMTSADVADGLAQEAEHSAQVEPNPVERERAAADAAGLSAQASADKQAGEVAYDSAGRRQAMAADLKSLGIDAKTAEERVVIDTSQGTAASKIFKVKGSGFKARRTKGAADVSRQPQTPQR